MRIPRSTFRLRFIPGLQLALLVALAPGAVAAPLFAAKFLSFDTGARPTSVAIGDLNGDGKPDLVVANHNSGTVSVLLGIGDGTFQVKINLGMGGYPSSVAIGDLNGDGKPDLAIADSSSSTVSVLLGNGDGTFGAATVYGTGVTPSSVAIGDLNGDGKPDLAVANKGSNTVSTLLGNGDGTFAAKVDHGVGPGPSYVAIGDLNGDGRPDLVTANSGAYSVSVLLGTSDGSFAADTEYDAVGQPSFVAIGDLNGDGKPDLAVAVTEVISDDVGYAVVLLGRGDGSFAFPIHSQTLKRPTSVAIGDLNGDGKPDLVVTNYGSNAGYGSTVTVLPGHGDGSFGAPLPGGDTSYSTGDAPYAVAIGDLNGDGKPDLAVANAISNSVSVLLGNGDGSFGANRESRTGFYPSSVAIGDLDGDGRPDLAVANEVDQSLPGTVSVLLGKGDGTFFANTDYGTGYGPRSLVIQDLNGDGKPDLVMANSRSSGVSVLVGNGDGTFGLKSDYGTWGWPHSMAIGDLNADGKTDLAVATSLGVEVLLGNGDGSFAGSINNPASAGSVAIGDLNGDGIPDVVVTNALYNVVWVFLGHGDGTFRPLIGYGVGRSPISVAIGDLNGDGKLDLAIANRDANTVSVLLGSGDGTFGVNTDYGTGVNPYMVVIGDLNGDGKFDLAVANASSNTVSVLLGKGDGSFGAKADYGTGYGPSSVAIGDLNGDGRPDLVTTNYGDNTVSVLLNVGPGIPTPTSLALVDSQAAPGRVELRWFGASTAGMSATVYRQTVQSAWTAVASITGDGTGWLRFADVTVQPGTRYGYRLGIREGGVEKFYGETWISVPPLALALEGLRPNPAVGELMASFTLPSGAPARLELFDVTGRVWLARDVGDLGAGSHSVHLGSSVPAGIYWLRLTQGGRSLLARGAMVK